MDHLFTTNVVIMWLKVKEYSLTISVESIQQ